MLKQIRANRNLYQGYIDGHPYRVRHCYGMCWGRSAATVMKRPFVGTSGNVFITEEVLVILHDC